jgi:hypothetical protein
MQSIRSGSWFLSLFVLTVAACGSSPTGGTGGGGAGGSGGQAQGGAGGSDATFPCPKAGTAQAQCQHGMQYCRTSSMGEVNCLALPAACGSTPSCSCVPLFAPACDTCTQSASGDLEVFLSADCPI